MRDTGSPRAAGQHAKFSACQRGRHQRDDAEPAVRFRECPHADRDTQATPLESHSHQAAPGSEGSQVKNRCQLHNSLAVVFLGVLMLMGCGKVRYPQSYTLNIPKSPPRTSPPPVTFGALAIREFRCPEYL